MYHSGVGGIIAIGPGGRAQAPARDDRCRGVIEAVIAGGLLDRVLLSPACRTQAQAGELRLALYRSARYYCSCDGTYCTRKYKNTPPDNGCPRGGQRISCQADIVKDAEGKLRVQFRMMDKKESMRHMVRKYGPDAGRWPYQPKRKQLKENSRA